MNEKIRSDIALVQMGLCESREKAQAAIMAGQVYIGEKKILKPSELITPGSELTMRNPAIPYVSRGAYKLKKALEVFNIDLNGRVGTDIGSSTGGFTDVMLRNGAKHVYCVDVGYNLLDYRIRSDERVTALERTNARFLTADHFETAPDFGATDVSFISLKAILPAVLPLLTGKQEFVALIKPQFEARQDEVGEKGVVRDRNVHERVLKDIILEFLPTTGWSAAGLDFSPVRGAEGNIEFLLHLLPDEKNMHRIDEVSINDIITSAYDNFFKSAKGGL